MSDKPFEFIIFKSIASVNSKTLRLSHTQLLHSISESVSIAILALVKEDQHSIFNTKNQPQICRKSLKPHITLTLCKSNRNHKTQHFLILQEQSRRDDLFSYFPPFTRHVNNENCRCSELITSHTRQNIKYSTGASHWKSIDCKTSCGRC